MKLQISAAALLLTILGAACDDLRVYSIHENVDQARADGAFKKGWLPEWIPSFAKNIHEHHDLDTNDQAISLEVEKPNQFDLPTGCILASSVAPPRITTKRFPESVHKLSGIHKCATLFVVADASGQIYIWGYQTVPLSR